MVDPLSRRGSLPSPQIPDAQPPSAVAGDHRPPQLALLMYLHQGHGSQGLGHCQSVPLSRQPPSPMVRCARCQPQADNGLAVLNDHHHQAGDCCADLLSSGLKSDHHHNQTCSSIVVVHEEDVGWSGVPRSLAVLLSPVHAIARLGG